MLNCARHSFDMAGAAVGCEAAWSATRYVLANITRLCQEEYSAEAACPPPPDSMHMPYGTEPGVRSSVPLPAIGQDGVPEGVCRSVLPKNLLEVHNTAHVMPTLGCSAV